MVQHKLYTITIDIIFTVLRRLLLNNFINNNIWIAWFILATFFGTIQWTESFAFWYCFVNNLKFKSFLAFFANCYFNFAFSKFNLETRTLAIVAFFFSKLNQTLSVPFICCIIVQVGIDSSCLLWAKMHFRHFKLSYFQRPLLFLLGLFLSFPWYAL